MGADIKIRDPHKMFTKCWIQINHIQSWTFSWLLLYCFIDFDHQVLHRKCPHCLMNALIQQLQDTPLPDLFKHEEHHELIWDVVFTLPSLSALSCSRKSFVFPFSQCGRGTSNEEKRKITEGARAHVMRRKIAQRYSQNKEVCKKYALTYKGKCCE